MARGAPPVDQIAGALGYSCGYHYTAADQKKGKSFLNQILSELMLAAQKIPDRKPPKFSKGEQIKHLGFKASF